MGLFVSTKHCQVRKVSRSIPNFEKVKYHQEKFELSSVLSMQLER